MSTTNSPKTVKELKTSLEQILEMPDIVQNMMKSITGIFTVVSVILETEGKPGWHKQVNKVTSETLTEKDEQTLQPLVNFIVALPGTSPKKNLVAMTGGGIDINSPFYALIQKIKELDATFGANAYIRRMEETSDGQKDPTPLKVLQYPLTAVGVPLPVALKIGDIPVPFRLLVAMGHSLLDILRLLVSLPGGDMPLLRQVFSVALASLEFFRGQWKQSLLSAAGVISQPAMYAGFIGKVFMNIFSLISPTIQEDIILGSYSMTKSLIIGILIKIFQITATHDVRKAAMEVFRKLAEKDQIIDTTLAEAGFPGRSALIRPDMSNPNRIQAALQDPVLTCSNEFQGVIQMANQNVILKLIFQMLNMPVSEEDLLHHCKRFQNYMKVNGYLSYNQLLLIEAGITDTMYKMYEEGKKSKGASGEQESEKKSEQQKPEQPKSEKKSEQQKSEQQISEQPKSEKQISEEQKSEERTPQEQTQTTTDIEKDVSSTVNTNLANSLTKLKKRKSEAIRELQETIATIKPKETAISNDPTEEAEEAVISKNPTEEPKETAISNDPTPPTSTSESRNPTPPISNDPTPPTSESRKPTVRNRVKAIEAKVKSQTEKQIEQQKQMQKGQRQKGGSRRIPRILKLSSLPSRKKRKSQPLSR